MTSPPFKSNSFVLDLGLKFQVFFFYCCFFWLMMALFLLVSKDGLFCFCRFFACKRVWGLYFRGSRVKGFFASCLVSLLRLLRVVLGVFYKDFEAVVDGGNRVESSWVNRVKWGDFGVAVGMAVRCAILVAWAKCWTKWIVWVVSQELGFWQGLRRRPP